MIQLEILEMIFYFNENTSRWLANLSVLTVGS